MPPQSINKQNMEGYNSKNFTFSSTRKLSDEGSCLEISEECNSFSINHHNDLKCSSKPSSSVKCGKKEGVNANKDFSGALLLGSQVKQSSISLSDNIKRLRNLGKQNYGSDFYHNKLKRPEKHKDSGKTGSAIHNWRETTGEIGQQVRSTSKSDYGLNNKIPLVLCSKDDLRKLVASYSNEKPIGTWDLHHKASNDILDRRGGSDLWATQSKSMSAQSRVSSPSTIGEKNSRFQDMVDLRSKKSSNIIENFPKRSIQDEISMNNGFSKVNSKILAEEKHNFHGSFNEVNRSSAHLIGTVLSYNNWDTNILLAMDRGFVQQHICGALMKDGKFSPNEQKKDYFTTLAEATGSVSPVESVVAEQPSPVSVLETPLGGDHLFYKRVAPDPLELQMQLDLLKLELDTTEESSVLYSEKETVPLVEDITEEFADQEERDFSYLLDMLINSGFHNAANQDQIYRACYEPNFPVGPTVFNNLEKKYSKLTDWSRPKRKLLFDLINSILAEILAPCMDLKPWVNLDRRIGPMWGPEGLVEKVWQVLVGRKEELSMGKAGDKVLDMKWPELGDGVDFIGKQMERMIKDELLEEVVSEFLLA